MHIWLNVKDNLIKVRQAQHFECLQTTLWCPPLHPKSKLWTGSYSVTSKGIVSWWWTANVPKEMYSKISRTGALLKVLAAHQCGLDSILSQCHVDFVVWVLFQGFFYRYSCFFFFFSLKFQHFQIPLWLEYRSIWQPPSADVAFSLNNCNLFTVFIRL